MNTELLIQVLATAFTAIAMYTWTMFYIDQKIGHSSRVKNLE